MSLTKIFLNTFASVRDADQFSHPVENVVIAMVKEGLREPEYALKIAERINYAHIRNDMLVSLAAYFKDDDQIDRMKAMIEHGNAIQMVRAYSNIATAIKFDRRDEFLRLTLETILNNEIVESMRDLWKDKYITKIAPFLAGDLIDEAIVVIKSIKDIGLRHSLFFRFSQLIPADRGDKIVQMLCNSPQMPMLWHRRPATAITLSKMADNLEKNRLFDMALADAKRHNDVRLFALLSKSAPPEQKYEIIEKAMQLDIGFENGAYWVTALKFLRESLADDQMDRYAAFCLQIIKNTHDSNISLLLEYLVEDFPNCCYVRLQEIVENMTIPLNKSYSLAKLWNITPVGQQAQVLEKTLSLANSLPVCDWPMDEISIYQSVIDEKLPFTKPYYNMNHSRSLAYQLIAKELPPELGSKIRLKGLEISRKIVDDNMRADSILDFANDITNINERRALILESADAAMMCSGDGWMIDELTAIMRSYPNGLPDSLFQSAVEYARRIHAPDRRLSAIVTLAAFQAKSGIIPSETLTREVIDSADTIESPWHKSLAHLVIARYLAPNTDKEAHATASLIAAQSIFEDEYRPFAIAHTA